MPLFEYTVLDGKGKRKKGLLDASSLHVARETLRKSGFYVVSLGSAAVDTDKPSSLSLPGFRRVNRSDLASITRQL